MSLITKSTKHEQNGYRQHLPGLNKRRRWVRKISCIFSILTILNILGV